MSTRSTASEEVRQQQRWVAQDEYRQLDWPQRFIRTEFADPDQIRQQQSEAIRGIVPFVASQVPYYQRRFQELGLEPGDIRDLNDLVCLPILERQELRTHTRELLARDLPADQAGVHWTSTSGSTGEPVKILYSDFSMHLTRLLVQRQYRWQRYDPMALHAAIRPRSQICNKADLDDCPIDHSYEFEVWPYVGQYFKTGAYRAYPHVNPVEKQMDWLERLQPTYLTTLASNLEYLALSYLDRPPPASLRGVMGISMQITAGMRNNISRCFDLPTFENYGLNEVGMVAGRCPEAGNFHVNTELCHVETVNQYGQACQPGETGRLLVTALTNPAMPLLRYDTGDLATAAAGPCPCGRTLPIFHSIQGRYRRTAFLPPATRVCINNLALSVENMPDTLRAGVRRYQLHQYRDQRLELRLECLEPLHPAVYQYLWQAWRQLPEPRPPLEFKEMQQIPLGERPKFDSFTSDFHPGEMADPHG